MEYLFVGIDVSKDYLDYVDCKGSSKELGEVARVDNTAKGINKLVKHLEKLTRDHKVSVCFEHTGHYSLLLSHILQMKDVDFSAVSSLEIIKSNGLSRGKSDPVDAKRIATYAATFSHRLKKTQLPSESILKLKSLLTIRDHFVRIRTQFTNALKALTITGKVVDLKEEMVIYEKEIQSMTRKIESIEDKISAIIETQSELKTTYNKISKVVGIGLITATALIVTTNNFTAFSNPRKFNCYCGLAPFEHSSGTSVKGRTKTSKYRNKTLKKLMFNAASSAIQHDPQLKTYFNRKIKEGKNRMSIKNAVSCKLIYRVFAVAQREEPYVKFTV